MVDVLEPDERARRLAEVYLVVGPLYRRVLRAVERDAPVNGMSVGVRAVLDLLARCGPLTVPQLGRAQSLSRQFVQRMVNDALGSGFVTLVANPAHRRSRLVELTGPGRRAIDAVGAREHDLLGRVHGDVTAADVDACLKVLTHMLTALDDVDVDGSSDAGCGEALGGVGPARRGTAP